MTATSVTNGQNPLAIDDLSVSYPGKEVIKGLDLDLRAGEVYGLLGRNGTGKTTLLKTLMRCLEPLKGTIRYWGREIPDVTPETWKRISYLGEMSEVLPSWTVRRILAFQERSYGRIRKDWVARLLGKFDIGVGSTMRSLSRGNQQMVGLILAICVEADILLLDEPAAGLDPVARRELLSMVLELMEERGATVLITSHVLSDLERIVDRIGFLSRGKIILEGSLDDLKDRCALMERKAGIELPPGIEILREHTDGRTLVTGDLSGLDRDRVQPLGLEDLYVELLGPTSREG